MKSYVAIGFGNNYFYALGEDALPISSDSAKHENNEDDTTKRDNPLMNLIPLHADITAPDSSQISNLQEWLAQNKNNPYTTTSLPIIACGTTHTTFVTNSDGGRANILGMIFGRVHPRPTPQPTRLPLKIIRLASGRRHVLALTEGSSSKAGGVLLSWGAGHFGQLGHGPELTSSLEPRIVERLLPNNCGGKIVDIAAGGLHSLAVVAVDNGHSKTVGDTTVRETKLFAWGSNRKSQCGIEGGKCATVPSPVPVVVVKREGRKSGIDESVDKVVHFETVAAGRLHSVGLTAYGEVFTWGSTSMGRCGHSVTSNPRGGDRRICQEPRYVSALKNVVVRSIAAGDAHTLALSKNGRVFAWGAGGDGQCGQGHIGNLFSPKDIREIYFEEQDINDDDDSSAIKVKANVKVESELAMEAEILSHDLGAAKNETGVLRIRAAGCYSAALTSNGDVYTWGYGGGLAMGHPIPANQSDLPMLPLIEGNQYSYATSAKTYPEGCDEADNIRDCVCFDTELNVLMPRRVEAIKRLGLNVEDLSLGPGHMVAICSLPSSTDRSEGEHFVETSKTTVEASDNNQTSDTDEVSSGDFGQPDVPDTTTDPLLSNSGNAESVANTSMTSTAEAASNISHESVESVSSKTETRRSGFLSKMKSSRSNRNVSSPNESGACSGKEKRKSLRQVGKLIDAAFHRK